MLRVARGVLTRVECCCRRSTVRLDMEGCGLGDGGCEMMANLFKSNKRIAEVDLQMNQVARPPLKAKVPMGVS